MDRRFVRQDTIDVFTSAIWTERYYGDSDVQLVVPTSLAMSQTLSTGTLLGSVDSDEVMILETLDYDEKGNLKVTGMSLCQWLNNRFIRTSAAHADRYWNMSGMPPGQTLAYIVDLMCITGPAQNLYPAGTFNAYAFKVPGLALGGYDTSGAPINVAVPFGPVYDALKELATTYQIGMQIYLESVTDTGYVLRFRTYRGLDRTSSQSVNPIVRFSPSMDSLTNIKELDSIANYKTLVYAYAPSNPGELANLPGEDARLSLDGSTVGFDLRALMIFAEDITTDQVGGDAGVLLNLLNSRARDALADHSIVKVVDGEIAPGAQFKYGVDYNLGDIIELQGNSGQLQNARITEFIRSQDSSGERAFPTVAVID
jgi:hypothetical protein